MKTQYQQYVEDCKFLGFDPFEEGKVSKVLMEYIHQARIGYEKAETPKSWWERLLEKVGL